MTSYDLLDTIGDANGKYIWQAQSHRQSTPQKKRPIAFRRLWLIAAIIALMLLLVGCVAYVLSLNDLVLGQKTETNRLTGEPEVHSVFSLRGFAGTPGYQAGKEWYEWKETYDPDGSIEASEEAWAEDFGEAYMDYFLYTREMKDKVDEICQKYGLKLLGRARANVDTPLVFEALGIRDIIKESAPVETDYLEKSNAMYFYENGAFHVGSSLRLTEPEWPESTIFSFRCSRKDTFDDLYGSVGPVETYEEWVYTNADGIDILMLTEDRPVFGRAVTMVADVGEFVFVVGIDDGQLGNILDGEYTIGKADLEALAECFDFTIRPQPLSQEDADRFDQLVKEKFTVTEEEQAQFQADLERIMGKESFEARVAFHLKSEDRAYRLGYCFRDLDGNGTEELLIGKDGYIHFIYTLDGEETAGIYSGLNGAPMAYLSEDGYLINTYAQSEHNIQICFDKVVDGKLVREKELRYNPWFYNDGSSPWRILYSEADDRPISQEEFQSIRSSIGKRVVLDMQPLASFPAKNTILEYGKGSVSYYGTDSTYNDRIRQSIINPPELAPGEFAQPQYVLMDLNADGIDDLIYDEEYMQDIYTLENGSVRILFQAYEFHICEGNIVEEVLSYTGNNKTYIYYRFDGMDTVPVAYLRYDEDRSPDAPWLLSTDASGQDNTLRAITAEEAAAIRQRYPRLDLNWKPTTEYPLP